MSGQIQTRLKQINEIAKGAIAILLVCIAAIGIMSGSLLISLARWLIK